MISLRDEISLENLLKLSSPRLGPITDIRFRPTTPGVELDWNSSTDLCRARILGGSDFRGFTVGHGQGPTPTHALIKGLAEALERYGGSFLPRHHQFGTFEELGPKIRTPPFEDLQILRENQPGVQPKSYRRLRTTDPVAWVQGTEYTWGQSKQEIWYPAPFLIVNQRVNSPYDVGTTSGFAFGSSEAQANVKAICEVMERDAFAFSWWTHADDYPNFSFAEAQDLLPPHIRQVTHKLPEHYWFVDYTDRWDVPCFAAFYFDDKTIPHIVCAAACALDPVQALALSAGELTRIVRSIENSLESYKKQVVQPPYELTLTSFKQHIALGLIPEVGVRHRAMLSGPREFRRDQIRKAHAEDRARSYEDRFDVLIQRVTDQKKSRLFLFDFTPDEAARHEFFLKRAKISTAVPIECSYQVKPWGCPGLRDFDLSSLNDHPHCFP